MRNRISVYLTEQPLPRSRLCKAKPRLRTKSAWAALPPAIPRTVSPWT